MKNTVSKAERLANRYGYTIIAKPKTFSQALKLFKQGQKV